MLPRLLRFVHYLSRSGAIVNAERAPLHREVLVRRIGVLFAGLAVFVLVPGSELPAGTLAGITLPDTIQVQAATLVLNGLGLRKKFVIKVYVAGLYVPKKSSDADAIVSANAPKRVVMHFVRSVSKSQMVNAFDESFKNNSPDASKAMKSEIDQLFAAIESLKEGDEMAFTFLPDAGTTLAVNGKDKLTIASPGFGALLFSVWLGPKPPNPELKKGLLGL
jgi:chalcone isomerase-like protein